MEKPSTAITVAIIGGVVAVITAVIGIVPAFISKGSEQSYSPATGAAVNMPFENAGADSADAGTDDDERKPVPPTDKGKNSAVREQLSQRIERIVASFVGQIENPPAKIAVAKISHDRSELLGPLGAEIAEIVASILEKRREFSLVKKQKIEVGKRGMRVVGQYAVEMNYSGKDDCLTVDLSFKDPTGNVIHKDQARIAGVPWKALPPALPLNARDIGEVLHALNPMDSGKFALEMTTTRGETGAIYEHGESLELEILAAKTCYLHLYYFQADGVTLQIFPNEFHQDCRIQGGQVYRIPGDGYPFDFTIDCSETSGMEVVKAVASLKPLPTIAGESLQYGLRGVKKGPAEIMAEYRQTNEVVEAMCTILTVRK